MYAREQIYINDIPPLQVFIMLSYFSGFIATFVLIGRKPVTYHPVFIKNPYFCNCV